MTGSPQHSVTLTDLARVLRRRWRTVLAGVLLGAVTGYGYLSLAPPAYTGTAEVALRLPVTNPFGYPGTGADRVINMNVEASLATSAEVVAQLAEATGRSAGPARESLEVEAPVGGQQLRFRYTAGTAEQAVRGANTAATSYLRLREQMYAGQRAGRVADYDRNIGEVGAELAAVQQRLADLPGSASAQDPAAAAALAELSGLRTELAQLRDARSEVQAVDVTPGWVTRRAEPPPASTHDRGRLLLLAGAGGGGLLGAVAAFGLESTSRRVRTAEEAAEVAGLPLAGVVRRRRRWVPATVTDADIRYTALALAARVLAEPPPQRLVLIPPRPDPAGVAVVTGIVAGLAVELAARGQGVFVASQAGRTGELRAAVLADQRRLAPTSLPVRRQPAAVGPPAASRSSGNGRVALLDARPVAGIEPLGGTIPVGAGTIPLTPVRVGTDPAEADSGEAVLVAARAAELSADGVLAARQGLAVVVVSCDRTGVAELRRLVERLRAAGATTSGLIVTRC